MEDAPPSYQDSTVNDVWLLVAPYLSTQDLLSSVLVCKHWDETFSPALWKSPSRYFAYDFDGVQDSLARFQQCLKSTRHSTRNFTHTLFIRPADAVYFDDRSVAWLADLFNRLPNLQSLIVSGASHFDHESLQIAFPSLAGSESEHDQSSQKSNDRTSDPLSRSNISRPTHSVIDGSFHQLRLLDASRCKNLTPSSLRAALHSLKLLIYLDLSFVGPASSIPVVEAIASLSYLKTLKLRNTGLKDDRLRRLANSIDRRVLSLDIRDNGIRTEDFQSLLEICFVEPSDLFENEAYHRFNSWQDTLSLTSSVDDFGRLLFSTLTSERKNHLIIEDAPHLGLQYLATSGNQINDKLMARFFNQPSLRSLDIGKLSLGHIVKMPRPEQLKFLRVDCSVIMDVLSSSQGTSDQGERTELQPATIARLKTLVLTNVPTVTSQPHFSRCLITFIQRCAVEAFRARQHAESDYTIPPGQREKPSALRESASKIFALEKIVLEMVTPQFDRIVPQRQAVTEDMDSEALWSAGNDDFSFFKDDDQDHAAAHSSQSTSSSKPTHFEDLSAQYDTIALLTAYRKKTKTAHHPNVELDEVSAESAPHWDGVIEIVRPESKKGG